MWMRRRRRTRRFAVMAWIFCSCACCVLRCWLCVFWNPATDEMRPNRFNTSYRSTRPEARPAVSVTVRGEGWEAGDEEDRGRRYGAKGNIRGEAG